MCKSTNRLGQPLPVTRAELLVITYRRSAGVSETAVDADLYLVAPGSQDIFHLDPVANLKSMQRLKDLAAKYDAELFFSHDAESFATYQKGANFYS